MHTVPELQRLYEAYLRDNRLTQPPAELYEPVNYILELGGKRLRPVLTLLSYALFRADVERALPVAHAVEIFHNFSLVHDDIMDKAPLRRGRPTVHERYDLNTAVLSGDVMLIYAYEFLLRFGEHLPGLVRVFNRVAIDVCEGQQYDMNFERRTDVTITEYLDMIGRKTAALIAGSLELGAVAAGAAPDDLRRLAALGRHLGIAFQLQDDLLDAFGDAAKVGKKPGGDIAQNKKTYLILRALELADPAARAELLRLLAAPSPDPDRKVEAVTALLQRLDIPAQTAAEKQRHQKLAYEHFLNVNAPPERKEPLRELVRGLIVREY